MITVNVTVDMKNEFELVNGWMEIPDGTNLTEVVRDIEKGVRGNGTMLLNVQEESGQGVVVLNLKEVVKVIIHGFTMDQSLNAVKSELEKPVG